MLVPLVPLLLLALAAIFNTDVAVSIDTLNTSVYSQYIAQLFPNNAQVLEYPDYSRYYAGKIAAPLPINVTLDFSLHGRLPGTLGGNGHLPETLQYHIING